MAAYIYVYVSEPVGMPANDHSASQRTRMSIYLHHRLEIIHFPAITERKSSTFIFSDEEANNQTTTRNQQNSDTCRTLIWCRLSELTIHAAIVSTEHGTS